MIDFFLYVYGLNEKELQWYKNNLNTKSYGHFTYKLLGKRRTEDAYINFYDSLMGFNIKINSSYKIPYDDIIKAIKKKFPNCNCNGTIQESKEFTINNNCRLKYDYSTPFF